MAAQLCEVDLLLPDGAAVVMAGVSAEPPASAADTLRLYAKSVGGKMFPKWIGPSGVDTQMQAGIGFNNCSLIAPGSGTGISVVGAALTNVGTVSNPTPTTGSLKNQTRRFAINSGATAGALASTRVGVLECWRGNAAALGGFFVVARFSLDTLQAGMRAYVGLVDSVAAPTNVDPTTATTPAKIGMAINANTGNWNLVHNTSGAAPTVIALGASFPVNTSDQFELVLFASPNSAQVSYRITNQTTNQQVTGVLTTNLPASTSFLARTAWATNNATAAAVQFSMSRFYLETDF